MAGEAIFKMHLFMIMSVRPIPKHLCGGQSTTSWFQFPPSFFKKKKIRLIFIPFIYVYVWMYACVCMYVCMYAICMWCSKRPEKGVGSLVAGLTDD